MRHQTVFLSLFSDVRVRNDLSVVHAQLPVTVVTPRPRGLQLLPSHRDSFEVPSCVHPSKDANNGEEEGTAGQPLVRVFAGTTLEVEPDLSTGVNVTFVFVLSDSRKSQVHKSVVQSAACWTTKCQDIKKVHNFCIIFTFSSFACLLYLLFRLYIYILI